jgi:tetratricopeptide (TPR) repeat protein
MKQTNRFAPGLFSGIEKGLWFCVAAAAIFLFGCQSMQTDRLYSSGGELAAIAELESMIVPIDTKTGSERRTALEEARTKIAGLEKSGIKDRNFEGRLSAWSGRLFLLEGKRKEAEAALKKSESLSPGNTEARVLLIRMENDPPARAGLAEAAITEAAGGSFFGKSGEFQVELALGLLEQNYYREAAAAFDTAFPQLSSVYAETYGALREKAWTLRNLEGTGGKSAEIALKSEISWEDVLELSLAESELLRFITAGQSWPISGLFKRLYDTSVIPPTQEISVVSVYNGLPSKTALEDPVLRAGAAWYLWHLLAENRGDRSILTRYSYRYPGRSPIPDLPRDSIFFDSILGCVEREFMALLDGRNFNGTGKVSGSEFLGMIQKVK